MAKATKAAKKPPARSVGSLLQLLKQINEAAPKRSKVSDGWIGDAKHAARHSDHNPEPDGTVDARDFTNDPTGGMDSQKLCDALVASRDPRISYIICNGKIIAGRKGPSPWKARKYTGANGHYHHIHVSVLDEGQDDKTPWKIDAAFKKPSSPKPKPGADLSTKQVNSVMHMGSRGEFVKTLQKNLNHLGYGPLEEDGSFGAETEVAVKAFQKAMGLRVDGWAGPTTLEVVGKEIAKGKLKPQIEKAQAKAQQAEAKVDEAKPVVDEVANDGKVTSTEWLTGVTGLTAVSATVKQIVDTVRESTESVSSLMSLGPWVLLGVVAAGAAGYVIYTRRKQRLEAQAVKKVL